MRSIQLTITQNTVLDGNGNGTIVMGPSFQGERWDVTSSSVAISNSSVLPQITLTYNGGGVQIDSSKLGGFNTSGVPYTLYAGQNVTAFWKGGPALATVSLSLTGTKTLP